jgi:hypothetical protein
VPAWSNPMIRAGARVVRDAAPRVFADTSTKQKGLLCAADLVEQMHGQRIPYRSWKMPGVSIVMQGADRIDPERAPRPNVSGEQANREQKQGRGRYVKRIGGLDIIKLRPDVAVQSQIRRYRVTRD